MDRVSSRALPLDPLRGFVAAARHLSFTRAAEELHLTQSAVSRQVQTLESALGVALFDRGVRSLALTEAGRRLAAAAEGWLIEYARLAARLRPSLRPTVSITASVGLAALWLLPKLRGFQAEHPEIDVRLTTTNRIADLDVEDFDLALRYCADRDAPQGSWRLFGETLLPVAHPAIAQGLELSARTLAQQVLLDYDHPQFPWLSWSHWLAAAGLEEIQPRSRLRFSEYDQLMHAAMAGQGLAIGRGELIGHLIAEGRLAAVGEGRKPMSGRGFWLVPAPGPSSPEAGLFAGWVRRIAACSEIA